MATRKSSSSKKTATKKAATKEPSDASLKELQKRLNDDTRLRKQFLKDPGSVLRRAGIELGAAKEQQLAKYIREVTAGPGKVFGTEVMMVKAGRARIRIRIMTRIGIVV